MQADTRPPHLDGSHPIVKLLCHPLAHIDECVRIAVKTWGNLFNPLPV